MAYNRKNLLSRIIEIQDITLAHTNKGVTQEWVYKNIIYPRFYIARVTYYKYMGINAKKELPELLARQERYKQMTLF
jgi:hypothetical protein